MEDEVVKIDYQELESQRREEILKKGEYARVEIIVGCGEEYPYCNTELKHCTGKEVGELYIALKVATKELEKQCPEVKFIEAISEVDYQIYNGNEMTDKGKYEGGIEDGN